MKLCTNVHVLVCVSLLYQEVSSVDWQTQKSDVESPDPSENDCPSIMSEDPDYMLEEISRNDVKDNRHQTVSTLSDSDWDEIERDEPSGYNSEVTSGYFPSNNGSGGQCSQSSTTNTGAPTLTDSSS